jgi:hypothetical protein
MNTSGGTLQTYNKQGLGINVHTMAKERAQCPFLKYPEPSSSSLLYGDHDYTVKSQFKVYLVGGIENLNSKQRKMLK